jgi:hypothetical protein
MAVLSRDDYLNRLRTLIGDNTDDDSLSLIQDMTETYDTLQGEDWHTKYVENDKEWRQKYRDAFFNGKPSAPESEEPEEPDSSQITIESLFNYKED